MELLFNLGTSRSITELRNFATSLSFYHFHREGHVIEGAMSFPFSSAWGLVGRLGDAPSGLVDDLPAVL